MATTMNAAPAAPAGQDPDAATEGQPGGYCIEIHVSADGKLAVSVEDEAEEAQEESGEADDEDDSQPVASIREACKLATQIFNSQGQVPDSGEDAAQMSAGYGKS